MNKKITKQNFSQKLIAIIFLLGAINCVLGQEERPINYTIDMFPKTPEAASLGKYVDIPPGDYTGVAVFSIPIYTIEVDGLKLPIELNYSTTGIKVSEIASRVGLGWALNIGTSLSKQVIGTPDLENGYRPIIMDSNFEPDGTGIDPNDPDDPLLIAFKVLGIEMFANETPKDIKPDIYSYSLPSGSGKYILDSRDGFGIPISFNQLKIAGNSLMQKIIDEEGTTYTFSRDQGVKSYNSCNNDINPLLHYPDPNYRITNVKTPKNREINFVYDKKTDAHYVTSMVEQIRLNFIKTGLGLGQPAPIPPKCFNHTFSDEEILTKIIFPGGSVHFLYNDDVSPGSVREDLPGDYYLKKVIVKDIDLKTIKEVTLHYDSYFVSPNSGFYSGEMFEGIDKRLKLTRVEDNLTGGEYKLTYYEENTLPHRLSNSQDYWGVYNGKPNDDTSIPTTIYKHINIETEPSHLFLGADKQPDLGFGVTGNLQRMEYPTKGYTEITYEADDYHQSIYPPPSVHSYTYYDAYASSTQSVPATFSIIDKPFNMEIEFTGDNDDGSGTYNIGNCVMSVYKSPNMITPVFETGQYSNYYKADSFEPGDYTVSITPGYHQNTSETAHCTSVLRWYEQELIDDSAYRKTGTLRAKKIHSHDPVTGEIIREFTYMNPTTNYTQTSGKNLGDEYLVPLYTKIYPFDRSTGTYITELMLSNNPGWQISTVRGKTIGYDYVQEIYKSSTESFMKEYKFTNDTDDAWTNHDPFGVINYTWPIEGIKRGLKLYEKIFDKDSQLKRKTEYEYNYDTYFNSAATTSPPNTSLVAYGLEINLRRILCTSLGCYYEFDEEVFPVKNYWIKNVKVTTSEYDSNENPTIVITDSMQYSPDYKHTFLSAKITENSLGETMRTEYYYPEDLSAYYEQSTMMNKLIDRNMIASPVITKTFVNQTPVAEQRTHYFHFYENDPSGGFILPQYVYAKKGEIGATSSAEDKKITYDYYDEKGNLTEYTLADGTPVSIIWGYNKQYPIAKVEGVRNDQITSHILSLESLSNNGTLVPGSFESLRNFNGAMVTCYIYEPLVGVTTIIQSNGQREIYEYDEAGRLLEVKDHNGNVLKKVEYNYKD